MNRSYSQFRAMAAITRASLQAIVRSPSAVIFSLGFPMVFILVFGFIGGSSVSVPIALKNPQDTSNYVIAALLRSKVVKLQMEKDTAASIADLEKGNIAAIVSLDSSRSAAGFTQYKIKTQSSSAASDKYPILKMALAQTIQIIEEKRIPDQLKMISVQELPEIEGRQYKMIDFILPGMLGFSLLGSAVFGVAFVFFNLRQTLVLKRFFATPINRRNIVFGEALSRIIFQLMTSVVIIVVGHYLFDFTLIHGLVTFLDLMVLSFIGLVVFMGFGFVISSIAKNESSIPPFANMFTLPSFLLGGTFFPTDVFPKWLQWFCEILPLKQLNDAFRNVAFQGATLIDCWKQVGILLIWGVAIYVVTIKTFKWE
ncbi:MAG: ABC transporter permease [Bacteroidota bacterium]|nr:ABC transporter permease [Bacteroidota bacterium]MDP4213574.1 ABC transporter permease [Bacteroidota bacterium]MDP4249536.1 ABC transporter permease [Bacteroidota bacterium]